jgi:hypothetical protein
MEKGVCRFMKSEFVFEKGVGWTAATPLMQVKMVSMYLVHYYLVLNTPYERTWLHRVVAINTWGCE